MDYNKIVTATIEVFRKCDIHSFPIDCVEESYKMDLVPFLEIDMLNLKDSSINELKKFCKANFDKEKILCALF